MSAADTRSFPGDDGLPVVAGEARPDRTPWIFGAVLLLGAILLFSALNARREAMVAPSTIATAPEPGSRIAAAPPLAVPTVATVDSAERPVVLRRLPPAPREQAVSPAPTPTTPVRSSAPTLTRSAPQAEFAVPPASDTPPRASVVFDAPRSLPAPPLPVPSSSAERDGERVFAERFDKPSLTIPRGTVIPAVLETALDSTRPGAARALVQRDVYSFDGSRVLVPRGSRLYGEYAADLARGQKRALITWTQLMRPDGVRVALDSPASDPLGRAGVKGKVDSKFFQRFGGAILQSILDVGVNVAAREAGGDTVVVALPGSTSQVSSPQLQQPGNIQPTLKVRHGTSVSVFVARDLDFSTVES